MEEKKNVNGAKMEIKPSSESAPQKLSYEELNHACAELSQQNQQLQTIIRAYQGQIQQLSEELSLKRLDYLFKVVKYSDSFDAEFVGNCIYEIKDALIIPEPQEKKEAK